MQPTKNLRVVDTSALPSPAEIASEYCLTDRASETIFSSRRQIQDVLDGRDGRQLVIVGPCSIHDTAAAKDYAARLIDLRERLSSDLLIVMRVYFEKPRTTTGWKGLINDPHLDETNDIPQGIRTARSLLLEINEMGMPCATELLDPIIPQYIADLVSWTAIGARTTESQTHREMASGLSMPVGFKNGTDGGLGVALNAMIAAAQPHSFLGIDDDGRVGVVRTAGNPYGHLVLRGGTRGPNYSRAHVEEAAQKALSQGVRPRLMIDCSHGNSEKDHRKQPQVLDVIAEQVRGGASPIIGAMIESHLVEGRQDLVDKSTLRYGQSVTDACVDFDTTTSMLERFARNIRPKTFHPAAQSHNGAQQDQV